MRSDLSVSAVVAGLIAVIVSYAGPSVIIFQAASAAHIDQAQLSSWIWAVSIGSGVSAVALSLWFRAPVITAWSTPGAALLVTALPNFGYAEAIGAFLFAAVAITALGASGLFDTIMSRIPRTIAAAMLAGILFRFGSQIFISFIAEPMLVGSMFGAYLALKRLLPRYAIALVLSLGVAIAAGMDSLHFENFHIELASPQWVQPEFSLTAIVGLGVPLALVTLTGQFVPGIAVLRASGYATPANPLVWVTSGLSILLAPFGAHGVNLAAITAAICSGPEAHHEAGKRYIAGVALGVFYIAIGAFGATLAALFAALPKELIAAVAGLALLGAIMNGLSAAMSDEKEREPALVTFLVTASGASFLGIGSAFWGLVVGILASLALTARPVRIAAMPELAERRT
jgi:benzoate membrane transport protein